MMHSQITLHRNFPCSGLTICAKKLLLFQVKCVILQALCSCRGAKRWREESRVRQMIEE